MDYLLASVLAVILAWLSLLTFLILRKNKYIVYRKIPKNKRVSRAKRYIIFYVVTESGPIRSPEIEEAVRTSVRRLAGEMWLELSSPHISLYDQERMRGIISCKRDGYKVVLASLPLIKTIGGREVLLVPKRTTGSFKKAKRIMGV
jgi:ribonuclease P/MRP protein subunit POP5